LDRFGNPNCAHFWIYDDTRVIATNPPIIHKICVYCGRIEHETGSHSDHREFQRIYEKFYRQGNK